MNKLNYPTLEAFRSASSRPVLDMESMAERVRPILEAVRSGGDEACLEYTRQLDGVQLAEMAVPAEDRRLAEERIGPELAAAIRRAYDNIYRFHAAQKPEQLSVETMEGVLCRQLWKAIEKVGLYIPGGSSPLFSTVLMLGIPAQIAGCRETVLCSPPDREGSLHPAILYAAELCGIGKIFRIGGAQAIAAMAYGTESIPAVYKIFGPGNQWVTAAKQSVQRDGVAMDMPAGPSEVAVIADGDADASFAAADLLSQAEHGPDSQAVLFSDSELFLEQVEREIGQMLPQLPRKDIAEQALGNSLLVLCRDLDEALAFSEAYAPEHLILQTKNAAELAERVQHAGSVFIGAWSPESAGDYASGTNHTLPTSAFARNYSALNLLSFMRSMTLQEIRPEAMGSLAPVVESMALAEGLHAHELAMRLRRKKAAGTEASAAGGRRESDHVL